MSYLKKYRMLVLLLVAVSLILVPGFTKDADAGVMIKLKKLDSWISNGYHEGTPDKNGYTKMTVIAVQTPSQYAAGHPSGAHHWNTDM